MRTCADQLKRVTLELGGKSPNIVFADADLGRRRARHRQRRVRQPGRGVLRRQPCVRGGRRSTTTCSRRCPISPPASGSAAGSTPATTMGPLVSRGAAGAGRGLHRHRQGRGARSCSPGSGPADPALAGGYFVAPTIFEARSNDLRIAREEIFGPVMTVLPFESSTRSCDWPTTPSTAWPRRSGPGTSGSPCHRQGRAGRRGVDQRQPAGAERDDVGRLQAQRHRARARAVRARRLPREQADLHQPRLSPGSAACRHRPTPTSSSSTPSRSSPSWRARSRAAWSTSAIGSGSTAPWPPAHRSPAPSWPSARAWTSAGSGSGPTTRRRPSSSTPRARRARAVLALAGGGGRAGRRRTRRPSAWGSSRRFPGLMATLDEHARGVPDRPRLRLRQPRRGRCGRHRAGLRAVVPQLPHPGRPCPRWTASSTGSRPAASVADVGCGAGVAVCLMAEAFPASEVHGYDISRLALDRAERRRARARPDQRPLPRRPRTSRCPRTARSTS